MGFYMFVWRKGQVKEATIIGVTLMLAGVIFGKTFADSSMGHTLVLTPHQIVTALGIYAMAASVMPVWMLLTPRSYLSTFMKIGVMGLLAVGVIIAHPTLQAPAFSQFINGGGIKVVLPTTAEDAKGMLKQAKEQFEGQQKLSQQELEAKQKASQPWLYAGAK